jgi:hypothetical protein
LESNQTENRSGSVRAPIIHRTAEMERRLLESGTRQKSAVTNGKRMFVEAGDGNGPWARRMRDVIELHISDLGGLENASEAERSIIRRAATLTIELERLEAKFSTLPNGPRAEDLDLYQRASNSLRRLLESIGIQRRPRDVTPSVEAYLAARKERK